MKRYFNFTDKEFYSKDVVEGFNIIQDWYIDKMNREMFELSIHQIDPKKIDKYREFLDSFSIEIEEDKKEEEMAEEYNSVLDILQKR